MQLLPLWSNKENTHTITCGRDGKIWTWNIIWQHLRKKWKNKIKIITKLWQNWKNVKEDTVKKKHNAVSDIEEKNEKRGNWTRSRKFKRIKETMRALENKH